jgi:hypothetical protein
LSDQWGAAQPPYDPQQQGQGPLPPQAPNGGSGQQQYGQAPQFGAPAPDQSQPQYGAPAPDQSGGQQQYPYGQSQSTLGTPGQFQAQPQYGDPGQQGQPQYGDPAQPGYGQPQQPGFGPDPYGGAYAGAPYGGAAPKQTNGLALAGAIVSFIPVVGLVLSIIGLIRAKMLGGAGKTAATVGLVLSILFTGGAGFGIYKLANSTAADPACISSESAASSMESKLNADETALTTAENSSDSTAVKTALDTMISDMQTIKGQLDSDVAEATHADVKAKLQAFDTDLGKLVTDLKAVENGDTSAATDLEAVANRLGPEGDAVDSLCGNATNG